MNERLERGNEDKRKRQDKYEEEDVLSTNHTWLMLLKRKLPGNTTRLC